MHINAVASVLFQAQLCSDTQQRFARTDNFEFNCHPPILVVRSTTKKTTTTTNSSTDMSMMFNSFFDSFR
jgi:anaerobic ribonucleoside-triphosphate reductase